jgi:hypothetical protein
MMADEVVSQGGGAAAGGSGGGSSTTSAGGSGGGAGGGADTSAMSDAEFLGTQAPATETTKESTAIVPAEKTPAAEATGTELIKPGALEKEEGEPEWFETVKDAKASAAARELWKANQVYAKHFAKPEDVETFFKELPGGREQVAALQTLGKEVAELDSAIEGSDFAGHLSVAERVLGQAPANAVSITRAWAQTVAKSQPEAWHQISTELVDSTLKAAGIGVNLSTLLGEFRKLRAAVAAQDGDALGLAVSNLIAEPEKAAPEDPNLVKLRTDAAAAKTERDRVLTETWETNVNQNVSAAEQFVRQQAGTKLATILMDSTPQKTREKLLDEIVAEVGTQVSSNQWVVNQISSLVGSRANNARILAASKDDWAKALQLSKDAATPALVSAAVRKIVSAWAKETADANKDARNKAKGGAARADVGGSSAPGAGKGRVTLDMVKDKNLSDEELLNSFSRK